MKKLSKDQSGVAHLLVILVFVLALAGIVGVAYTRISHKNTQQTAAVSQSGSNLDDDSDEDEGTADDQNVNDEDPSAVLDEDADAANL